MTAPVSIGSLPSIYARRGPSEIAVSYGGECLTWDELERGAIRWAHALVEVGVVQDDMVALTLPNGVAFHQAAFAIWKLGATPCVFSARLPGREAEQIMELARPRAIIGDAAAGYSAEAPRIDVAGLDLNQDESPLPDVAPQYWKAVTSGGSTGRPKIIVDHHASRIDPAASPLVQLLKIPQGGVMLNPGPLYHNAPFLLTSLSLISGTRVIGMHRFDAEECLRLIAEHRVQWVCLVPTMMHRIWSLPPEVKKKYDLSSLEQIWHMAAACPAWLKRAWIDWFGPEKIWELYGGTESGSTIVRGDEWLRKPGTVGRVDGDTTRVLDENGNEAPRGVVGEIFISSASRSKFHYIGSDLKTASDGSFSLGDLGHMDEDGYLFLADRRTDLIIRGGANIYPAEVEGALDAHPDILSSVVVGIPCEEFGERVHAILQLEPQAKISMSEISVFLKERIAGYKIPESFDLVDQPLRSDAGKVRRSMLKDERAAWDREGRAFRRS